MFFPARSMFLVGEVEVDPALGCVRRAGVEQHLRRQTFQVLLFLVDRRERVVTKEELIEHVWKGAAVTDDALVQCIVDLRKALGDDSRHPRFIKTFPKSGYRFIAAIEAPRDRDGRSEIGERANEEKEKNFIHVQTRKDAKERQGLFSLSFASLRVPSWIKMIFAKTLVLLAQLNRKE
jgi:DNA-binding winged helix-turn-helix (wHTH) protein